MKISKINNTTNFNARLCGDLEQIIAISKEGGLPEKAVKKLLNKVQNILPNEGDRVFFIFRKPYPESYWSPFCVRSQIEVLRGNDIFNFQNLRTNVSPFWREQKDLLGNFVISLKKLMRGDINSERLHYFRPEKAHAWVNAYRKEGRLKTGVVDFDEGLPKQKK